MTERKEQIRVKENLKNFARMTFPYKGIILILAIAVIILETSYIFERYLLKLLIDDGTRFAAGIITESIFVQALLHLAAMYVCVVILWVTLKWLRIHFLNRLDSSLILDMKRRFFNHLLMLDFRFHASNKTGSMISRLGRGSGAIENMMDLTLFNFAPLTIMLAAGAIAVLSVSLAAASIIVIMSLSFIFYGLYFQKKMFRLNVKANRLDDFEKGNMADYLTNVESIKYFGKEDRIKKSYKEHTQNTMNAFVRMWDVFRHVDAGQAFILGASALALMYVTVNDFISGAATMGDLAFVYAVYTGLVGPLFGFVGGMRGFTRALADFESLWDYEAHTPEITDRPDAKKLKVKEGSIEFKNLTFMYNKKKVLNNINLSIKPNTKIALVGHSGSGKSTLVKLLYRLYDIQEGSILIDGNDIRKVTQKSLREELSIVPQEAILFDDTLQNNIRFSNPKANTKEVKKAMKFAQLDTVVKQLPEGPNTIVGERGVKLSGGEKQRVSIARALLANKKILVLDEATSALDSKTEHEIQTDLEKLMKGRTSIIIAHRLSTIMHADKIIVLNKGRISQEGKHRTLIKQKGIYKELWNLQQKGYIK